MTDITENLEVLSCIISKNKIKMNNWYSFFMKYKGDSDVKAWCEIFAWKWNRILMIYLEHFRMNIIVEQEKKRI